MVVNGYMQSVIYEGMLSGLGHAWNYVQMPDSKWYLLDTTWDNPSSSPSNASKGSTGRMNMKR